MSGKWQRRLVLLGLDLRAELLTSARNREALFIEKSSDAQHGVNIFAAVHSLSGAALHRFELREFRLPEAENIGRQPAKARNFADAEIEFVGNYDLCCPARFGFQLRRTHENAAGWKQARYKGSSTI